MKTRTFYQLAVAVMATIALSLGGRDVYGQTASNGGCTTNPTATGTCTFSAGEGSTASGNGSVAVSGGTASGTTSFSAGGNATGTSSFSASGGTANGDQSVAGSLGHADGDYSTGLSDGEADGEYAVALGRRTFAIGNQSLSAGHDNRAEGVNSVAIGFTNYVYGSQSLGIGAYTKATTGKSYNYVFGQGLSFSDPLENNLSNSIMFDMNSDIPTMFIEDAGGTTNDIGRVGIGTTEPDALLHLIEDDAGFNTTMILDAYDSDANSQIHFDQAGTNFSKIRTTDLGNLVIENNKDSRDMIFEVMIGTDNTEAMRIEGSSAFVGIGTDDPGQLLHVEDGQVWIEETDDAPAVITMVGDGTGTDDLASIRFETAGDDFELTTRADGQIFFGVSSGATLTRPFVIDGLAPNNTMWLATDGDVGIGTSSPAGQLDVNGSLFADLSTDPNLGSNLVFMDGGELKEYTSSVNHKTNIEDIEFDKDAFLSLRPVSFNWKDAFGGKSDVGLIAEEVEDVMPDMVNYHYKHTYVGDHGEFLRHENGRPVLDSTQLQPWGVDYRKISVYLLSIVKSQDSLLSNITDRLSQVEQSLANCCDAVEPHMRENNAGADASNIFKVHPNPSSGAITIAYEISTTGSHRISLVSPDGRKSTVANSVVGKGQLQLSLDGSSGIYSVLLETLDGILVESTNVVYTK